MKISFIVLFVLFFGDAYAASLIEIVKKDDFLLQGNIAILEYAEERYLVSVGVADEYSSDPLLRKRAQITAKVKAQHQLSQFIYDIEVNITETLEEQTVVVRHGTDPPTREWTSKYMVFISEINEGPLKNIVNIGSWTDEIVYYHAISIKIPQ